MSYIVFIAAVLLLALSLTPHLKKPSREIELASHFALQYALAALGLCLVAGFTAAGVWTYIFLLASLLLNLSQFAPFIGGGASELPPGPTLKILQANVLKLNQDTTRLRRLIAAEKPDIIMCAEVTPLFATLFTDLAGAYPYGIVEAEEKSSYGMALLSRLPLEAVESLSLDGPGKRALAAQIVLEGTRLDLVSIHPATPNRDMASRDREFAALAARYANSHARLIIGGDFNATPYCAAYKALLRQLPLKNAREGRGIMGTFPVFLPTAFLKLPIDHILAGEGLRVTACRLGPDIGSDHLPTIATVTLQAA